MRYFIFAFILALSPAFSLHAQGVAHVNFGNLLSEMPATQAADTELEALDKQLNAQLNERYQKWQEDVAAAEQDRNQVAPVRMAEITRKLQERQQELQEFQRSIGVEIEKKRRVLLGPIIDEAKAVIARVAEAEGYTLVIDSSIFNSVLFAEDATDITERVKAELGI